MPAINKKTTNSFDSLLFLFCIFVFSFEQMKISERGLPFILKPRSNFHLCIFYSKDKRILEFTFPVFGSRKEKSEPECTASRNQWSCWPAATLSLHLLPPFPKTPNCNKRKTRHEIIFMTSTQVFTRQCMDVQSFCYKWVSSVAQPLNLDWRERKRDWNKAVADQQF